MRIYYDETRKNIVLGEVTRLFASGSLMAWVDRGRVAVVYVANNFRELFIKHDKIFKEDGSPAGSTLQEVIDYLNQEFNKTPVIVGDVPVFIQNTQPTYVGKYKWIQTNVGGNPEDFTIWFNDGV